jgi:hypothetical protein
MMISKQQARAVADYIRTKAASGTNANRVAVSPEILRAAFAVIENSPDTDPERIDAGRRSVACAETDSHLVASMMIRRIISEGLR